MARPGAQTREVLSFGPFSLVVSERLLTRDGAHVALGARALDTLIALVSRANEAVAKRDLIARVWPDVTVDEGSLRFHVAGLRKALGDGVDGARYIATLPGRGYCFVAPVSRSAANHVGRARIAAGFPGSGLLPPRLARMVGRADDILSVSAELVAERFVTVVGPGGVGKTTVAVAVAQELREAFSGNVLFLDLGALSDPETAVTSLMALLGISARSDDPIPSLVAYVRDKRILLVLDNCEHVIDAAASLAAHLARAAPQVHILATSREALRVEGERVHRLKPLAVPPEDASLVMAITATFPAVALFMERAAASGARLELRDADAATVARICRRLDGVPLAIELAAARVEAYGLQQTLAILDQRLTMLWLGQRSAPERQRSLQATLDWSFGLLSGPERLVLRRLAVFAGSFSLEAALAVVASGTAGEAEVLAGIESLVAKSMLAAEPAGGAMRYRLLNTTRTYILDMQVEDAELRPAGVAARGILPAVAGADRGRMADPPHRCGARALSRGSGQCARRPGVVLRRRRRDRDRHRTRLRRRAGLPGDVPAHRVPPMVRAGDRRPRGRKARRGGGDAPAGGVGPVLDVHAGQLRGGVRGIEQEPGDRGGTGRLAPPAEDARPAAHLPPSHRGVPARHALRAARRRHPRGGSRSGR